MEENTAPRPCSRKDYLGAIDPKWCPGCGAFPILSGVTAAFAALNLPKEKIAVVSGIGCSSRFPYYLDTFGFHTIHGRPATVAMGLKTTRPDLSVWVVSGDGDSLSIGGNHFLHMMRRNPDINYLLLNNQIYGLTKGQASPTSAVGTVSKTSVFGSIDTPVQPLSLALTAGATFAARVLDSDLATMKDVFQQAERHKGISFVEILFNCVTFADKALDAVSDRKKRSDNTVMLKAGEPIIFGKECDKGIRMKGTTPEIVALGKNGITEANLLVHDPADFNLAFLLSRLQYPEAPLPLGVFRQVSLPAYHERLAEQKQGAAPKPGEDALGALLRGRDFWEEKMESSS